MSLEVVFEIATAFAAFIMFSGALGLALFRDSFQRFHAAGKVSVLGLALLIIFDSLKLYVETGILSLFGLLGSLILLFVGPFASHVLSRTLYRLQYKKNL